MKADGAAIAILKATCCAFRKHLLGGQWSVTFTDHAVMMRRSRTL